MLLGTPVIPGTLKPGRKRITSLGKIATSCIEKKIWQNICLACVKPRYNSLN